MNDNVVDMGGKPVKSDNVIPLDVETFQDIDPKKITEAADKVDFEHVMIVGWEKNGEMYFASSQGSAVEIVLDLEICKRMIMDGLASGE